MFFAVIQKNATNTEVCLKRRKIKVETLKTNTRKVDYHISVKRGDKLEQTFVAHTDSVCNALKSAYEQCCGWTRTPIEPLPEQRKDG